jgi:hypothetical protein
MNRHRFCPFAHALIVLCTVCGFALPAAADRERPVIVRLADDPETQSLLPLWTAGIARPFDTIALPPGTTLDKPLSEGDAGWWSAEQDALYSAADGGAEGIRWIFYDMSRPEAMPTEDRVDLEEGVRALGKRVQGMGLRLGIVLNHDLAAELIPRLAPYVNACIVEMPSPTGALADEARQYAIAVNDANSRCRFGVYFPPAAQGAPYDPDAFLAFYEASHEFTQYYAVEWRGDADIFAGFLTTVNKRAPGAAASQGMYADTMQAPSESLSPEVERRLRMVLMPSALVFVAAVAAFVYFYARPSQKSGKSTH